MLNTKKKSEPSLQAFECEWKPVAPGRKSRGRMLRGSEWAVPGLLSEILAAGLRHIRTLAEQGNHQRCSIEALHLQNLPALLAEFNADALDRYWTIERTAFAAASSAEELSDFEPMWTALAEIFLTRKAEMSGAR